MNVRDFFAFQLPSKMLENGKDNFFDYYKLPKSVQFFSIT